VLEQTIIYGTILGFCILIVYLYLRKQMQASKTTEIKIEEAKVNGLFEPVSLHPVVDAHKCIACGSCITACPEEDILGIRNNVATTINASHCVGHGACFHACPVEGITLVIGTEERGVDLPHVNQDFESNVPGIFIAGEMGGMGLIKNSVEQGKQAVFNIKSKLSKSNKSEYDMIIVGAGPAGISATLTAKMLGIKALTLEQDTLGGTVYTFPRSKIVMTAPMDLPLYGKVKLFETSKGELLKIWKDALRKNNLTIREKSKVEEIAETKNGFQVFLQDGISFTTQTVLLAIGRRGTPRKLDVPGENTEKVAYRLLEPEQIIGKKIMVVGGGDSAIESALLLADQNEVILSYRRDQFNRLKPKNLANINEALEKRQLEVRFNTQVNAIHPSYIDLQNENEEHVEQIPNDLIYIFAGGELPTKFLEKVGIKITRRFGYAILKHQKKKAS